MEAIDSANIVKKRRKRLEVAIICKNVLKVGDPKMHFCFRNNYVDRFKNRILLYFL